MRQWQETDEQGRDVIVFEGTAERFPAVIEPYLCEGWMIEPGSTFIAAPGSCRRIGTASQTRLFLPHDWQERVAQRNLRKGAQ